MLAALGQIMIQELKIISPSISKNMPRSKLHFDILSKEQERLLPMLKTFSRKFGLVGGTAIALQVGHRRSIDFDFFTFAPFNTAEVRKKVRQYATIEHVFVDQQDEYTIVANGVRVTFFHYPFSFKFARSRITGMPLADLSTLAALKAYALGRRAKWKDYVDLYFIMKGKGGVLPVVKKAQQIFGNEFNEKLFRTQLAYFKDIDRSEEVIFMKGCAVKDGAIQKALIEWSVG